MARHAHLLGGADGYAAHDRARWVPEPPKSSARGDFARDRARVLHSSALRRLGAKTQVVGPGSDDFARTRLTHSLEVAQVGRELGGALGCDPDVVDAACLAHDLGHPPFGHNGESALAEVTAAVGGFEGNAQTLRLLTRLEPKVVDAATGRPAGLNLTRASLDAATKYPWGAGEDPRGPASPKFGFYAEDAEAFAWLRSGAPERRRCVEAQAMDLADDIAYSVHDVEDAVVAERLDLAALAAAEPRALVAQAVHGLYLPDAQEGEVEAALDALLAAPYWVPGFDGSRPALAALKDMTSQLIGRFCGAVQAATRERTGPGPLTRYAADLVLPRATAVEVAALKGVAAVFVLTDRDRVPVYAEQRAVVQDLVHALLERPERLEPPFASDWREAGDDGARLRAVADQVASLTDASALAMHAALRQRPRAARAPRAAGGAAGGAAVPPSRAVPRSSTASGAAGAAT
ncbi:deoxyguanosinetriphosphate triphosphohydrolase [Quadrisphaera sp. DSM 44207]|uniref:deoxyguanosinetriphosphate triphosphohydrolase n=1 Tax=Quadrisphaera sp. DSM 44207 TaxID=1881057 RepID=UPI00088ACA29|nr:deoxyguanosinetriphosphate triphosphohydrolase [Quadrisphaera sp. DSM 44207]SDQ04565.1 dGTPase [Quadrisphaera sp. DSM 44207]